MHMDKDIMISERSKGITPFLVMEILERASALEREGRHIIHMEVGEPDFETPACITNAAVKALEEGKTKYSHSLGILELREAVCENYQKNYGVTIHPDQIIITSGTSPAMFLVFAALLNTGDQVILSDPHYACYPSFIHFMGGETVKIKVFEEDAFQYRPESIKAQINERSKGIIINSPSNPTGNLLSPEVMKEIARLGPWIISDEIYHGLVYEGKAHSILEYTDHAFVINGFSKLYAMTGWRLGYLIAPKPFIRPMQIIQQNFFISPNSFVQYAGLAALTLKDAALAVQKMADTYNKRRKYILPRLREIGFGISVEPTGAFYVLANAQKYCRTDSMEFALELLERAGVAVTPGIDFGENAEGFIRFSYATSIENIAEGMDRLEKYLREQYRSHQNTEK
ncbi:MAG: pyridoxal phosphate-dependent aminotransferase [bacterium]